MNRHLLCALVLLIPAGMASAGSPVSKSEKYALTHDGSREQGEKLYVQLGCVHCHGDRGQGSRKGPPLAGLGKIQTKADLVASILRPDEKLTPGYVQVRVLTSSGKTFSGRLQSEDAKRVELLLAGGERKSIARDDIERLTRLTGSGMPAGLTDDLTAEEFADLVAFVSRL